mmetsp:Transcript_12206/g.36707  ORF Transcript_12206/g.36707 Transcript_12206/m.36707 type:complete len:246 (-) Transcript_12206:1400-2137(-)
MPPVPHPVEQRLAVPVREEALHLQLQRQVEQREATLLVLQHRKGVRLGVCGVDDVDSHLLVPLRLLLEPGLRGHHLVPNQHALVRAQQSDACGVVALAPKEVCNRVLAQKHRPREEVREVRRGLGEGGEREHAGPPLRLVDVLEPDANHVLEALVRAARRRRVSDPALVGEKLLLQLLVAVEEPVVRHQVELAQVDELQRESLVAHEQPDHVVAAQLERVLQRQLVRLCELALRVVLLLEDRLHD